MSDDAVETVETTLCTNCKHDILSTNFVIHTIHCQRNIYLCPKCDEPVNRGQQEEHDESYHKPTFCTSCHIQLEKCKLQDHLSNDCPKRRTKCQICDIDVEVSEISEHENYCGARTEKCQECGEFVMLKYKQLHLDSNHTFIKLSDEPGPSPSWQNGRRFLGNFLADVNSGNIKPQSGQKKKSVQNRTKNTLSDHYEKKSHNDAVGSDSNEKNNYLPANETESYKTKKTMPTLPKETALGAVKKTISTNYSPSYVPNKIYDNIEEDRMKNRDKPINKVLKKSLNTDKDTQLELDRLLALQISEDLENQEKLFKKEKKTDVDETASLLIAMQIDEDLKSQEALLKKKPVVDETADLILALELSDRLNGEEDTSNDHLLAQHLSEESGRKNEKSNAFLEAIEKSNFIDEEISFKNIFEKQNEIKTVRKPDLIGFSDDSDDELGLLAYAEKGKKKTERENVRLPCEFCEKMIPANYLNTHQEGCKDLYKKNDIFGKFNSSFEEEKAECALCGRLYAISKLDAHEKVCMKAIRLLDESMRRSSRLDHLGERSYWKKLANANANQTPSNLNHTPRSNNDQPENFRRNSNPPQSFGAVPRTHQACNSTMKSNNKSFKKK